MARWCEFVEVEPQLAEVIRGLLHQYGPGLAYLATVRADGGPRVHPVSPVINAGGLYCFIIDSPKRRDLDRDGRYALHAFPPDDTDDEACLSGRAVPVTNSLIITRLAAELRAEPRVDWRLFEFTVETAMVVRRGVAPTSAGSDDPLARRIWRDPAVRSRKPADDSVQ
jgi:hypothetical protein